MDLLRRLSGVNYRVASTVLHFAHPETYMILDVRVKWSLGWDLRTDSVDLWIEYTARVQSLARRLGVTLRTLDLALWEYSKRHQRAAERCGSGPTVVPPPHEDEQTIRARIAELTEKLEFIKREFGGDNGHASQTNRAGQTEPPAATLIDLERRFHTLMKDLYQETGRRSTAMGKPYWSNYFNRSVTLHGGLVAARRYLSRPDPQGGFQRMIDLGLEHISLEAVVLQHPWQTLFTANELATARRRLRDAGLSRLIPRDARP